MVDTPICFCPSQMTVRCSGIGNCWLASWKDEARLLFAPGSSNLRAHNHALKVEMPDSVSNSSQRSSVNL